MELTKRRISEGTYTVDPYGYIKMKPFSSLRRQIVCT